MTDLEFLHLYVTKHDLLITKLSPYIGDQYEFCSGLCKRCELNKECDENSKALRPVITTTELNNLKEENPEYFI